MVIEVQVISERTNSYTGKRGRVDEQIIACLDITPEHPFINTFDYTLSEDEEAKHAGKLVGSRVRLAIIDMGPEFGGRIRFKGSILKVNA